MGKFDLDSLPAKPTKATPPAATGGAFELDPDPDIAPNPGTVSRVARIGRGIADPIEGGAQLLYNLLPKGVVDAGNKVNNALAKYGLVAPIGEGGLNADIRQREEEYQASRGDQANTFDAYRTGGNIATSLIPGVAGVKGVQAASLVGKAAVGAVGGAAGSALNPTYGDDDSYWKDKGVQAATGAALGAAAPLVVAGAGRVISPNASRNAELALLRRNGVNPTIGQALGGVAGRIEEKATSYPIAGDFITAARQRARGEFNDAAIDRVYGPLGARRVTSGGGHAAVADAGDAASAAYQRADMLVNRMHVDQQAQGELASLRAGVTNLGADQQRAWQGTMSQVDNNISPNGHILPENYKSVDSLLGQQQRRFRRDQNPFNQDLGDAFGEVRTTLRENARRANPAAAGLYDQADRAWANLVRVEGAAKAAKGTDGVFTPGQLLGAIQTADGSVRKRAVSRGEALLQDLGTAGQNVLGNKIPNSGTADRLGNMAAIQQLLTNPLALAHTALAPILYSSLGQRALVGAVASRPQAAHRLAPFLLRNSTKLSPGMGLLGPRSGTKTSPFLDDDE